MSTDKKVMELSNVIHDLIMDAKVDSYEALGALEIVKTYIQGSLISKAKEPEILVIKRLQ